MSRQSRLEGEVGDCVYREAEHDSVRVIVAERAQPVELFLPGCVPQTKLYMCVVDVDVCT